MQIMHDFICYDVNVNYKFNILANFLQKKTSIVFSN